MNAASAAAAAASTEVIRMSHATLALLLLFSISTAADQLRYDSARDPEDQVLHFHQARIAEGVEICNEQ